MTMCKQALETWVLEDIHRDTDAQRAAFLAGWVALREIVLLHDAHPDLSSHKYQTGFRILREILNDQAS